MIDNLNWRRWERIGAKTRGGRFFQRQIKRTNGSLRAPPHANGNTRKLCNFIIYGDAPSGRRGGGAREWRQAFRDRSALMKTFPFDPRRSESPKASLMTR